MPKNLVAWSTCLLAIGGVAVGGATQTNQSKDKCRWVSELFPAAVIQIQETSPIGIISADLVWKGKVIRQLEFGEPNGYGSKWWRYKSDDGDKGVNRLLPFLGNQPARGHNWDKELMREKTKKVLLVGLGSNLYYTEFRGEVEILRAAEGFWRLDNGCNFPGVLWN